LSTHTQRQPVGLEFRVNRIARAVAVGVLVFAFGVVAVYSGYFAGQATRPTDAAIAAERQAAIHVAVTRAVAAKGAADHQKRLRIVARHVAAQRVADRRMLAQAVLAEQRAGDHRAALAYARGRTERAPRGVKRSAKRR
jgi:hypothetical protein